MIYGRLSTARAEWASLPAALRAVLAYLQSANFDQLATGRHSIRGEEMFMMAAEYATKAPEAKKAEQHKKYIDVHYIIAGAENIGLGYPSGANKLLFDYNEEKDCTFYSAVANEVFIPLTAGMFAVFYPWEIHRPGLDFDGTRNVRKAVVKVSVGLL